MCRFSRVSLFVAAISGPAFSCITVADRAEAKGVKSFAAKVGTAAVVRSIIKSGNNKDRDQALASDEATLPGAAAQVTGTAEPAVAPPPLPPVVAVGPANTGLVCIAGCYDAHGRSVASN